ncbi:hypothetical protein LTR37_002035 [Vermiconidia calcicola]|uniref:Uncharacterized protein n=1 Tax=Vermiconidia calcicola TaxID=1690605 RepID=A0ACC3NTH3_9PEZI|nr:hypothetical protein LTR37_002035 [Vermiconidia calcicola]
MDPAKSATAPEEAAVDIIIVMLTSAYTKIMSVIDYVVAVPQHTIFEIHSLTPRITASMPGYVALGPLALLTITKWLVFILSALTYDILPALLFYSFLDGILPVLPQSNPVGTLAPTQVAHDVRSTGMVFLTLAVAPRSFYFHIRGSGGFYDGYRRRPHIWTAALIPTGMIWALVKAATLI